MYGDVIFGCVLWIWLSISHFVLNILILFSPSVSNFSWFVGGTAKSPSGPRGFDPGSVRRFAPLSALRSAPWARRTLRRAADDPLQIWNRWRKKIKISEQSAKYQLNPHYQPKKRRYLYNKAAFFTIISKLILHSVVKLKMKKK